MQIELVYALEDYKVAMVLPMMIDGKIRSVVFNQLPYLNGSGLYHIEFYLYVKGPNQLWSGEVNANGVGQAAKA